jgi:hypothetical protein
MVVRRFVLCRGNVADHAMQATVVEPVHVVKGGVLDVLEPGPRAALVDELTLVQAVERLRSGVVVRVASEPTDALMPASASRSV